MTETVKKRVAIGGGVLALAAGAFVLLGGKGVSDIPGIGELVEDPKCPLTGLDPAKESLVERPAVAVKVENAALAYPLSGLADAEIVYEELVEGGVTRFMAIYHCNDSAKAGPVRSARIVDPAIMTPMTRILAYSGENSHVLKALKKADVVRIDEDAADGALFRVSDSGLSFEHTLFANTAKLRKLGRKSYDDAPPDDLFTFGELEGKAKRVNDISINFSAAGTVRYEWNGEEWLRFEGDEPFMAESGEQVGTENVLIEEHMVDLSDTIFDVAGNPSIEIADEVGSGRALLFRDGRVVKGTWLREEIGGRVVFRTRGGDEMVFAPGSIWIELVPSKKGEVTGSFDFNK